MVVKNVAFCSDPKDLSPRIGHCSNPRGYPTSFKAAKKRGDRPLHDQQERGKLHENRWLRGVFKGKIPCKWYLNLFGEGSLGLVENLHGSSRVLRVDPAAGVTINSWSRCHQGLMFITSRKGKFLNDPTKNHQSYIYIYTSFQTEKALWWNEVGKHIYNQSIL